MTDNAVTQDNINPDAPQAQQPLSPQQQLEMVKSSLLGVGLQQYHAYRNFLRQLSVEPAVAAALLQKLDDTWVWVRVIVSDMQLQAPVA